MPSFVPTRPFALHRQPGSLRWDANEHVDNHVRADSTDGLDHTNDLNCTDDLVCTDAHLCMDTLIRIRLVRIDTLGLIDKHVCVNGNNALGLSDALARADARSQ